MDQLAPTQCDIACPGNPGQRCGGAAAGTVLVAECEQGWTRFGEKCLMEVTFDNLDSEGLMFTDGMQTCAAVRSFFITIHFFTILSSLVPWWFHVVSIFSNRRPICHRQSLVKNRLHWHMPSQLWTEIL